LAHSLPSLNSSCLVYVMGIRMAIKRALVGSALYIVPSLTLVRV
jgi:hypothetical protein